MDTKEAVETRNKEQTTTSKHMPDGGRIIALAIGDAIVFLVFAAIGRRSHNEANSFFSIVLTALPFMAGWFIASPFVGAYKRRLEDSPRAMVKWTLLAWLAAWPLGLILRGVTQHEVPPVSFAIVTLISNTLLLLLWRWPFAVINKKIRRAGLE